jgi:hypothetical protein
MDIDAEIKWLPSQQLTHPHPIYKHILEMREIHAKYT